jgi:HK97 family phage major capsid protein
MDIKNQLEEARRIAEVAAAEGRALNDDEQARIDGAMGAVKSHNTSRDLAKAVDAIAEEVGVPATAKKADSYRSLGEKFVNDPALKSWLGSVAHNGLPDAKSILHSPAVNVAPSIKALITGESDTSAGALLMSDYRGLVDQVYGRELSIAQLITTGTTNSDAVEYARISSVVNAAVPTIEATAVSGSSGYSAESTLAMERAVAAVRELKHWLPVTSRAMADAPELASLTDAFLRYGIAEELEDQVISGDGTGENMEGILSVSGTLSQAFDTDIVTSLRKALTNVRVNGRARPSAILMNPADNEKLDLLTAGSAGFVFGGPVGPATQTFFGIPRVESVAVPEGTAIVADFREAVLLSRSAVTVQMSNQHSDFFLRGLVAVLATARAAFFVRRPSAFCIADIAD